MNSEEATGAIAVFRRSAKILVCIVYGFTITAFVADFLSNNNLAYGIVYAPLVATSVLHRERRSVWIVAAAACLLVIIGALYPVTNSDLLDLIGNRVLSILAILATALFVAHARDIQARLEEQTRRARAAETIKSEVLADLGSEMG